MTKPSRVIVFIAVCLAGFMGQVAAFGASTNSTWDMTGILSLSVSKLKAAESNSASAVFLSDGTCTFLVGASEITGTYTSTTKQVTVTLDANGLAALESNVLDFASGVAPEGVTVTVNSVKASKIKLSKTGVPVIAAYKVSCEGSETVGNKTKTKKFSVAAMFVDWALTSGTAF